MSKMLLIGRGLMCLLSTVDRRKHTFYGEIQRKLLFFKKQMFCMGQLVLLPQLL